MTETVSERRGTRVDRIHNLNEDIFTVICGSEVLVSVAVQKSVGSLGSLPDVGGALDPRRTMVAFVTRRYEELGC